ncbi:hypothetical protein SUGI_0003030 [Cryptomeria japonica]|nr:hypothetical protein SUGI_0003030 [Cryptomeria japonica]
MAAYMATVSHDHTLASSLGSVPHEPLHVTSVVTLTANRRRYIYVIKLKRDKRRAKRGSVPSYPTRFLAAVSRIIYKPHRIPARQQQLQVVHCNLMAGLQVAREEVSFAN